MRFKSAVVLLLIVVIGTTTFPVTGQEEPLPAIQAKGSIAPLTPSVTRSIVLPTEPIAVPVPLPTLEDRARANDFVTFDALYRDAVRRGDSVAAFAPLHELWTYAITDPIGAFYNGEIYERLARAYPDYSRFIAEYRIVDSNGNVFYPTSETRTFLLDRALEGSAPNVRLADVSRSSTQRAEQLSETSAQSVWDRSAVSRSAARSTAAGQRSTASPRRSTAASGRSTATPERKATAASPSSERAAPRSTAASRSADRAASRSADSAASRSTDSAASRRATSPTARTQSPAVATSAVPTPTTTTPQASAPVAEKAPIASETAPIVSEKAPVVADTAATSAEAPVVVRAEPTAADTPVPAPQPIAVNNNFGGRGVLLLVIGLLGAGLLAMMLRAPREAPTSIMQPPPNAVPPPTGDKPSGPTPVEPLRRPSAAPEPPPPGKNRASGSHG